MGGTARNSHLCRQCRKTLATPAHDVLKPRADTCVGAWALRVTLVRLPSSVQGATACHHTLLPPVQTLLYNSSITTVATSRGNFCLCVFKAVCLRCTLLVPGIWVSFVFSKCLLLLLRLNNRLILIAGLTN